MAGPDDGAVEQLGMDIPVRGPKMTTRELRERLSAHYGQTPHGALLPDELTEPELLIDEVPAPGTARRVDVLRLGLWPSSGRRIIGHELKVSRGDWLRELADPGKAAAWWPYVHEWWIVAPPHLIDPGELPPGWGLMVPPMRPGRRRFEVVVPARVKQPEVTVDLLIEVVRRVDNQRLAQLRQAQARR